MHRIIIIIKSKQMLMSFVCQQTIKKKNKKKNKGSYSLVILKTCKYRIKYG